MNRGTEKWSQAEDDILRSAAAKGLVAQDIVPKLRKYASRQPRAIQMRANRIGLSISSRKELTVFCENPVGYMNPDKALDYLQSQKQEEAR